ncbi:diaminopimelate epimerase [Mucisphaera sp.]|uniref:diaminopimelate epimerase n=1 Tax=Mucisphaera sp. TaxID=2913024 RepID=UPI003D12BDB2
MPTLPFTKMHGLGNDYVYINAIAHPLPDDLDLHQLARNLSDRHRGIGSDGLILAVPPTPAAPQAHARMRMFNVDGSEGDMCGNGLRCLAKLVHDQKIARAKPLLIETGNGVLTVDYTTDTHGQLSTATVDMGPPRFEAEAVPLNLDHAQPTDHPATWTLDLDGEPITFVAVNTGNPHAVIFTDDLTAIDLRRLGPQLEHHPAFPARANIHWAQVLDRHTLKVIHWERGSGPTQACGTGATAAAVAAIHLNLTETKVTTKLPGGPLQIEWKSGSAKMTGEAVLSFTGSYLTPNT